MTNQNTFKTLHIAIYQTTSQLFTLSIFAPVFLLIAIWPLNLIWARIQRISSRKPFSCYKESNTENDRNFEMVKEIGSQTLID